MSGLTEEDDILAAEFALGLLDADEAVAVQTRARTDGPLSLRIAWWRDQLAPLANEATRAPPPGVWDRIEAQLPGNDNSATLLKRWRGAAIASMSLAALLVGYIVARPVPTPTAPIVASAPPRETAPIVATLEGVSGATVRVLYDERVGQLELTPVGLERPAGDAELWLVHDGFRPLSLGVVGVTRAGRYFVPDHLRKLVTPGSVLAITKEAKGGSPTGNAQGPIMVAGEMIRT